MEGGGCEYGIVPQITKRWAVRLCCAKAKSQDDTLEGLERGGTEEAFSSDLVLSRPEKTQDCRFWVRDNCCEDRVSSHGQHRLSQEQRSARGGR